MSLENQIYTRKSCRKYLDDEMDMASIHDFMSNVKPLIEGIDYHYDILTPEKLTIRAGWSVPYYLAIYSDKKEFYQENVGFVFQQLSLYLQSIGIGSCWVGMASPKIKDDEFVIVISFGKSNDMTRDVDDFKRKRLCEISDSNDKRLTPARLAPSAINSQPWYFKHCGKDLMFIRSNRISSNGRFSRNGILLIWVLHCPICMLQILKLLNFIRRMIIII